MPSQELTPFYPLARGRNSERVSLPPEADGFAVYRQASRKGGRPGRVIYKGNPLSIELDTTEAQLAEVAGGSGRYRLDVLDIDGNVIEPRISCWVSIDVVDLDAQSAPPPTSAGDAASIRINHELVEITNNAVSSLCRVVDAFAGRIHGGIVADLVPQPAAPPREEEAEAVETPALAPSASDGKSAAQTVGEWVEVAGKAGPLLKPALKGLVEVLDEAAKTAVAK
ncbi:MAG TPA: hypothetical protein VE987_07735 [Polyangiaceae bacterium]|nr:hypothetical protein [Polyangiaceae bacterium]